MQTKRRYQYILNADSFENKWGKQRPELFSRLLDLLGICEQFVAFKELLYNDV